MKTLALACFACLFLAGCMSSNIEDAMEPIAAAPAPGPHVTDTYPELSATRHGATEQLTEEEAEAMRAELAAAATRTDGMGGARQRNPSEIRRLAESEQEKALQAIEGE